MDELIPRDLCDTDLYKMGMGQLVFRQFDGAIAKYRYINRAKDKSYPKGFADRLMEQVRGMADLRLTSNMYQFFKSKCPFLRETYLQWFRGYRYDPSQVRAWQNADGTLEIEITGRWFETIYWEVPLLYIITQLSRTINGSLSTMAPGWEHKIEEKARRLAQAGVNWIDFGTRRRASYSVQDKVNELMEGYYPRADAEKEEAANGKIGVFRGTSNPYFAMKYNLTAHGTCAHEIIMAMQARYGLAMCNVMMMKHWVEEFGGNLGIALTDTITTPVFLRDFDRMYARLFDGVRQDSGDPKVIGDMFIAHYQKLGIDPMSKVLVLSDSLNTDKAIELHQYFKGRIKTTMGIGTHLTNDVGWTPSNHVIKLVEIDFGHGFQPLLKLSDDVGKELGGDLIADAIKVLRIHR
jgi:nicotinate phosphoribosyltransferase